MDLIQLEEAVLLFNKWSSEGATVLCTSESLEGQYKIAGTVSRTSETEFAISSAGQMFIVSIGTPGATFAYAEAREVVSVPGLEASALVVSIPAIPSQPARGRERLIFIEIPKT
jgi:hypothetical protein